MGSGSGTMDGFIYQKLIVWQKAMAFWQLVYAEVKKFPSAERYALSDQVRRAAVSVASNIAEGAGRASNAAEIGRMLIQCLRSSMRSAIQLLTRVVEGSGSGTMDEKFLFRCTTTTKSYH